MTSMPRLVHLPRCLMLSIFTLALLSVPAMVVAQVEGGRGSQEGKPKGGDPQDEGKEVDEAAEKAAAAAAEAAAEAARLAAEHQRKIKDLFVATGVEFDIEGRVALEYNFEGGEQSIAADWGPRIEDFNKRVRWSRGWEGGTYAYRHDTIVVAESGIWSHKAVWRDLEMDVQFQLITEIMKPGDIVAAVYTYDKGKRIVGSNIGEQCVSLNSSLKLVANPIPPQNPLLHSGEERTFGFKLKDGLFTATQMGRSSVDTAKSKNFLKKLTPGHAGFAWRGEYMKGYLIKVTLRGNLDDEWLSDQLNTSN